jgi:hypothetical protein
MQIISPLVGEISSGVVGANLEGRRIDLWMAINSVPGRKEWSVLG